MQAIQRADHFAQNPGRHLSIECRALQLLVSEQNLDHPDIHLLLQQVGGEAVAQGVHRDALINPGDLRRLMDGSTQLSCADRVGGILARKQPATIEHPAIGASGAPPGAQALEQNGREHRVAILAAFALLDAQGHALTIDVADLQCDDLAHAQASAVGNRQCCLVS